MNIQKEPPRIQFEVSPWPTLNRALITINLLDDENNITSIYKFIADNSDMQNLVEMLSNCGIIAHKPKKMNSRAVIVTISAAIDMLENAAREIENN